MKYGADDAFILAVEGEIGDAPSLSVVLKHLKSRNGETRDIALTFDRPHQRFTPDAAAGMATTRADEGKLTRALRAMWERAAPAQDDGVDDA